MVIRGEHGKQGKDVVIQTAQVFRASPALCVTYRSQLALEAAGMYKQHVSYSSRSHSPRSHISDLW